MHIYQWLQNLLYFLKHYRSILIVTKYYTNLFNYEEGNERLNKNMKNWVYFHKNWYYDANSAAMNFVLLDKTRTSIRLKYENATICKNPLHFPMRVSHILAD